MNVVRPNKAKTPGKARPAVKARPVVKARPACLGCTYRVFIFSRESKMAQFWALT